MTMTLEKTPLFDFHRRHDAKMVPFAGYEMPQYYPTGHMAEHMHTRRSAGLFDVSHMGQIRLTGDHAAEALEALVPSDITGLKTGRMRYTILTSGTGGILDDLIVTKREDDLFLVINSALKDVVIPHLRHHLPAGVGMEVMTGYAMLALQGPDAVTVLASRAPGVEDLAFMRGQWTTIDGVRSYVTRSGYTGEDGFEIALPASEAEALADRLAADPAVMPAGLDARDSLRMEAGLNLSGQDFDETTTPGEADLAWLIGERRRENADFLGAERILEELRNGPQWKRVGLQPVGRVPARQGAPLLDAEGRGIGAVTSGGYGPSVAGPIALGYVEAAYAEPGTRLTVQAGGQTIEAVITPLPFWPQKQERRCQQQPSMAGFQLHI